MSAATDPDFAIRTRAVPENVPAVRHALGGVAAARGADADLRGAIALAVTEAVSNVVRHAYPRGTTGIVEVEVMTGPDQLSIVVRDMGEARTDDELTPGFGAGLRLIDAVTDSLEIAEDAPGTEVRMRFALVSLGPEPGSPEKQ